MANVRETRFALVLNGGVSLAVWMGGVTHELNRLRLASADAIPPDGHERRVHEAWTAILQQSGQRVVVDAIAGTSAGGLNGTLLASAVAGGKDLPAMRSRWSDLAALRATKLLPDAADPMQSLLNGAFFEEEIDKLLQEITDNAPIAEPSDCSLLVTATAIDAKPVPVKLEGGGRASVADSRRVFRFDRRTDDLGAVRDDFASAQTALTRAARASASFPGAFEPVWESDELHGFCEATLGRHANSWLIDGGVLDNAPFGPLIRALRERPVGAPFERVVLYVTPSPGNDSKESSLGSSPDIGRVLGRVVSAAREPDQRLDFEELQQSFRQMGYSRASAHDAVTRLLVPQEPTVDVEAATDAAQRWFKTYQYSRAEAIEQELARQNGEPRLIGATSSLAEPEDFFSVPRAFDLGEEVWGWGLATAERLLRWWGRALVDCVAHTPELEAVNAFMVLQEAQRRVARLVAGLEERLSAYEQASAPELTKQLNSYLGDVDSDLRTLVRGAAEAVAGVQSGGRVEAEDLVRFSLAVEVISSALAWSTATESDTLRFRYQQVTPAAMSIVDIGEVANEESWLSRKLYGERLGHFGAFLDEEGRQADWLWGRLDGASALCDHLLGAGPAGRQLRNELADAILAAENTTREGLRRAAADADRARKPLELLQRLGAEERSLIVDTLWRRGMGLIERSRSGVNGGLNIPQLMRALADPTWSSRDVRGAHSLLARLPLRLVHLYGSPMRWFVRRSLKKHLRL